MNPDLVPDDRLSVVRAARGLAGIEQARADLAEDLNLNPRLVLERAFLRLAELPRSVRLRRNGKWCWHHWRSIRPVGR